MKRAAVLGRFTDPGARLVAVAIAVGVLLVIQVIVLVWGGVLAAREGDRAVDDSFAYLADVSQERVVAYAQATQNVAIETVKSLEFQDPGVRGLVDTLHGAVTSRSQVDAAAVIYPDGTYAELSQSKSGRGGYSSHVITIDQNIQLSHVLTEYDTQMRQTSSETALLNWDPRTAACYRGATLSLSSVWSKPEVDPLTGRVQMWVCEAARRANGEIFAVVAVSMNLEELGQSLNALPAGSDGQVFLFAKDREFLAVPSAMTATWQDLSKRAGTPPLGEFLGVETDKRATPSASADVFGNHGKLVVLERGLGGDHLDWVIHLRATEVGVNEGFTRLRSTVVAIAVGLVVLTAGIGYLLSQMWRPLINVRKVAERDPLTGLYNRHHVGARISRTMDSARRGGHEAVVIMLDIDNFKELNDDLGHIAGDQALADISTVLAKQTRASDMAVRWGGDEFLVVLRLPIAIDAAGAVERIRARAEEALKDRFRGREGLGVTAGFAVSPDGDVDIDALIASADAALVDGKWLKKGATYGAQGSCCRPAKPGRHVHPGSLVAVTDSARSIIPLDLSGAKGKIEVTGALGIVARVQINGERARPQRGGWSIPLKNGGESKLMVKGFIPGFQRFVWNGDTALQLGGHVGLPEKIAMFAPFLLMVAWIFLAPISLALFMMSIPIVKNPLMPRALRIAIPIINTVAGAIAWMALVSMIHPKA